MDPREGCLRLILGLHMNLYVHIPMHLHTHDHIQTKSYFSKSSSMVILPLSFPGKVEVKFIELQISCQPSSKCATPWHLAYSLCSLTSLSSSVCLHHPGRKLYLLGWSSPLLSLLLSSARQSLRLWLLCLIR